MIELKEYQIIERYNIHKWSNQYDFDYNIYDVKSYKLFGIITLFKTKKLIKNSQNKSYGRPKRRERY